MFAMRFSIFAALAAFIFGLALGHYAFRSPESVRVANSQPSPVAVEVTSSPGRVTERHATVAPSESSEKSTLASTESLIADLKVAISRSGSRRSYAAFSKISDSVNEKNVREVLGIAEGL